MNTLTKVEVMNFVSMDQTASSASGNLTTLIIGGAESYESAFSDLQHQALFLPGANFNFVFDYPEDRDVLTLHSGCTFHEGSWFPSRDITIPESDG